MHSARIAAERLFGGLQYRSIPVFAVLQVFVGMKQPCSKQRLQYPHRLCQDIALQLGPLPESQGRPAQSTRPTRTRTGICSPSGHPLRPATRPHSSQALLLLASVPPPTPWLLAKPCSHRWCTDGSTSSSLSHRSRPAPARRTSLRPKARPSQG